MLSTAQDFNQAYLKLHIPKEELFWTTYMGTEKNPDALEKAESLLKTFASNPENLKQARAALKNATSKDDRVALEGWVRFFEANAIENEEARKLQLELIEAEAALFQKRGKLEFKYRDREGKTHTGSTNVLSVNVSTSADETVRKTSHDALLELEQWVLANGFIEQVKLRNRFARALGFPNYFACKLMKNEGLTIEDLDTIFVPFEKATREKCFSENARLAREKGESAILAHNLLFSAMGDVAAEIDPYFPFSKSMARWGLSFWRLGIRFRGAKLTLDLLDRKGKYENGFMHGPGPCYFDQGKWIPARINFTSNATPNQVGNGRRGLDTFFHEGGHAAHFSNILQPSPCFSQEFPPTSMAYAETQSMFCDSLVEDADWQKRYAHDRQGNPISDALMKKQIEVTQPLRAFRERSILVVPIFEKRLYELPESELTPERITKLMRDTEKEVFGLPGGAPRPLLAIPHLLSESGACSYQGYLLANMAVYQTRDYFMKRYGSLTDQSAIGKEIAEKYWAPGNAMTHAETVKNLTGKRLSGDALARLCNASNEETWAESLAMIAVTDKNPPVGTLEDVDLDAEIRVVHGNEVIAETKTSFAQMARDFEAWIEKNYPPRSSSN